MMFRWLKDKKKQRGEKKGRSTEDDYGFTKRQIILQQSENGHSVIIKDSESTVVYPQSFCEFNYRARMPTPIQNFKETSSHIYDEIPEVGAHADVCKRLQMDGIENEADIVKDTRAHAQREHPVDLKHAIEVGPYLIVPIVNSNRQGDIEIFKRNDSSAANSNVSVKCEQCACGQVERCECGKTKTYNSPWDNRRRKSEGIDPNQSNDTKVVLTRCVKSKSGIGTKSSLFPVCSGRGESPSALCSFPEGAVASTDSVQVDAATAATASADGAGVLEAGDVVGIISRTSTGSPGADSNSRTLTGTPESSTRTPDTLSEGQDLCAISDEDVTENEAGHSSREVPDRPAVECDGNDTCCEYDISTSGESEKSTNSDYDLYLSKIENNLIHKHNVRRIIKNTERGVPENAHMPESSSDDVTSDDVDTMTYVSSLSEQSSATSHVSDVSADRSASDDSGGYYECTEEISGTREKKRESRVNLERSVSAPDSSSASQKFHVTFKKCKGSKGAQKSKKSPGLRSHSFDSRIYKALSDEDKEMYMFPSSKESSASTCSKTSGSRSNRNKPVLAPQPTPVHMDPYRGKSLSHNRLLGDLIRMNYDKQLFIH